MVAPEADRSDIDKVVCDSQDFGLLEEYLKDEDIEDIMVNNTSNIFVYQSGKGSEKAAEDPEEGRSSTCSYVR